MKFERSFRVLRNDPSELRPLSRWAQKVARNIGLPAAARHDIDLCLQEAVSNIIRHGCEDGDEHRVTVRLEEQPGAIRIQVEDDARPFNPLAVPPPADSGTIENARTSGYGMTLIRAMARDLSYDRVDGRNLLTLVLDTGQRT
jgi:anti-sigma regulatory factor (Ser/Thr protein kinase)